ncbi:YcnI family protein [Streptomyces sp. TRM 70351]|uniref:YcnI family copper-binding membrane protein n=1 Tax=Streptomyces sp. TRM 70351 TaxID=3116552 RepID=UPI002E7B4018|nr:YcnI family protein [Streptomyces sp. TRM 70351]MEE1929945.1 YcnI family protein [Streptomyces sp. TRM 70351]
MTAYPSSPGSSPSARAARPARRTAAVSGLAAAAVLAMGGPALAHVTVDPKTAPGGGYSTINFKVPNERDNASTIRLEVSLPTDHPLASVMPEPVPGWDVKVEQGPLDEPVEMHGEQIDEAPAKITWSGGTIEPGTFQRFPVSVGQLPDDADRLVFKAVQTYDNDDVVRWIEIPEEGGEEPGFPAPVLELTDAGDAGHGGHDHAGADDDSEGSGDSADSGDAEPAGEAAAAGEGDGSTDTTARVLGAVGIAAGLGGIAFGVLAGRRRSA